MPTAENPVPTGPLTDTTAEAARVQARVLREMSPRRRLELAVEMSLTARELVRARLLQEHPDWTEMRVKREVLRLTLPGLILPPGFLG